MFTARARKPAALALGIAVLLAGCSSSEDEEAPAACLAGSDAYLTALRAAPGEVRLQGETPISDCLTPDQEGGQLASIGKEMIDAATELNAAAQQDPGGPEALQLGYLTGRRELAYSATEDCMYFTGARGVQLPYGYYGPYVPSGWVPPGWALPVPPEYGR